jgi:hypothetical protein
LLWEEGIGSREKYLETSGIDDRVWVFIYLILVAYSVCRIVSGYSFFLWLRLHRTIYNMCTQEPPQDYSQQLYDRYRESFQEYINSMVCEQGASLFPFPCFCACREKWPFM